MGGTFFSGIDTPELSSPSIEWKWRAEIDPFCNAVSEFHRPGVPNLGDMENPDLERATPVDVAVFGSPCQSFSVAGKRLGLDDPRGNLALVALRAIGRIRPRWFVFENVPGLLSSHEGRDFGTFLGAVGELGYGWAYRVLDAQFAGVPQRRRRPFFVGYLGDWRPPAAVLFERESLSWNPPPRREEGEDAAGTIGGSSQSGGQVAIAIQSVQAVRDKKQNGIGIGEDDVMYTVTARDRHAVAFEMQVRRLTPKEWERLQGLPDDYTRIPWRGKPASQCSDGPRYKAIGNAMAKPVIGWVLERLQAVDAIVAPARGQEGA